MTEKGCLFLVPNFLAETPAENVFPPLNGHVLSSVRHFIVENPKPARQLIKKLCPETSQQELILFHLDKHQAGLPVDEFLAPVLEGFDMGLISDAGCPGVADPGALIVAKAHEKEIKVVPLVGPSSLLLALMASGMNGQKFRFWGYLPFDKNERRRVFREMEQSIRKNGETQLFIETPYRNDQLLAELIQEFPGEFKCAISSNLTGEQERNSSLTISSLRKQPPRLGKTPAIFLLGI